jgi:hypothetical protein
MRIGRGLRGMAHIQSLFHIFTVVYRSEISRTRLRKGELSWYELTEDLI